MINIREITVSLGKRVFVFYLFVFLVFHSAVNMPDIKAKAGVMSLNRYRPDFVPLVELTEAGKPIGREAWLRYVKYFEVSEKLLSHHPDIHGMKGFCYYQLGLRDKAARALKTAIKKNPTFFWFHYNLGVLYYQADDFENAEIYLKEAVRMKPEHSLFFYSKAKSYRTILQLSKIKGTQALLARLKVAYANAYKLLALISYQKKDFKLFTRYIQEGAKLGEISVDFWLLGGLASLMGDQNDEALKYLLMYTQAQPNDKFALELTGKVFHALKRDDVAQRYYDKAKTIRENEDLVERGKKIQPQLY